MLPHTIEPKWSLIESYCSFDYLHPIKQEAIVPPIKKDAYLILFLSMSASMIINRNKYNGDQIEYGDKVLRYVFLVDCKLSMFWESISINSSKLIDAFMRQ